MTETIAPAQRIIPGAPSQVSAQKSQKKKRKAGKAKSDQDEVAVPDTPTAALVEQAPGPESVKDGLVAPELLVKNGSSSPVPSSSQLVETINKRLKATNKKIVSVFPLT